jgi:hypothetical protein
VISAFGDSIFPTFPSTNKPSLAIQQLFEGHHSTERTAKKYSITDVLFIDWLQGMFISKVARLRERTKYDGNV